MLTTVLDRYRKTWTGESTPTPAIVSYNDGLSLIEAWTEKEANSYDKLLTEYHEGLFLYQTPEDKVEFPIAEVRRFITDTSKKSYTGRYLYVLVGIDTASLEAMNALLKVLEDTPEHAIILLVVENREALLETIHSRTIDLFSQETVALDRSLESTIADYYRGRPSGLIEHLHVSKPTREHAINLLILALSYAENSEQIEQLEQGLVYLFTTNESPRNILDLIFLR